LLEAEAATAQAMRSDGVIVRIWRIPGRLANVGIWSSPDATTLHDQVTSLPLAAHADIEVTALATRYLERS
jgi:muconolactone D-isomerase